MLPAGLSPKHTAIPAHACVQTGKPSQRRGRKLKGFRKTPKIIPRREREETGWSPWWGRIMDLHLGIVLNDKLFLQF